LKRLFDLLITVVLLAILLPVMALVFLAVRIFLGRPVLLRHSRPGYHNKPFLLYKFRTMTEARDSSGQLLPDEERITFLGKILRQSSLDETPQLFNVLRGDMSLVGPRPLLLEYLALYTPEQIRRHEVRPGITGWAQINGRNSVAWDEKFKLDVWYVDNQSLWLDVRILLITIYKVLSRHGVSAQGKVTMSKFSKDKS
jgi:sugar transferase EpsL